MIPFRVRVKILWSAGQVSTTIYKKFNREVAANNFAADVLELFNSHKDVGDTSLLMVNSTIFDMAEMAYIETTVQFQGSFWIWWDVK